jgi:hypothetical protein
MHAHDLEPLNVRGRYAFALTCIERLCNHWGATDPFISELIDVHWTLVAASLLSDGRKGHDWFEETSAYDKRTPAELAACLNKARLSAEQIQALHHAVYELRMLAGDDMYCEPESFRSLIHVLNVVGILLRWGVELPALGPFRKAGYPPGKFGYYGPYCRADFLDVGSRLTNG